MNEKKRRWFVTPCGLDCYQCPIRLRTEEELDYWRQQHVDPDTIRCDGCRSDRQGHHWSPDCNILQCCVYDRGYEFCAECPDFPCTALKNWGEEYEHHARAVERLNEMKTTGVEMWLKAHGCADAV